MNLTASDPNNIATRINAASSLVSSATMATLPASFTADQKAFRAGSTRTRRSSIRPTSPPCCSRTRLDKLPVFNLMVMPGVTERLVLSTALAFCERKRAFLMMDPPITDSADGRRPAFPDRIQTTVGDPVQPRSKNAALYFPYLLSPDPITGSATNPSPAAVTRSRRPRPSPGIFAATDHRARRVEGAGRLPGRRPTTPPAWSRAAG